MTWHLSQPVRVILPAHPSIEDVANCTGVTSSMIIPLSPQDDHIDIDRGFRVWEAVRRRGLAGRGVVVDTSPFPRREPPGGSYWLVPGLAGFATTQNKLKIPRSGATLPREAARGGTGLAQGTSLVLTHAVRLEVLSRFPEG